MYNKNMLKPEIAPKKYGPSKLATIKLLNILIDCPKTEEVNKKAKSEICLFLKNLFILITKTMQKIIETDSSV